MSQLTSSRGATTTMKASSRREGCQCGYDDSTGKCCDTNRCGCRKKNKACGPDCSCYTPACKCRAGERSAVLRQVKREGSNKGRFFWTCSKKLDDDSKCDFFAWQAPPEGQALGNGGVEGEAYEAPSAWSCAACTFLNPSTVDACEMCASKKPVRSGSSSSSRSRSSSSSSSSGGLVYRTPCSNTFGRRAITSTSGDSRRKAPKPPEKPKVSKSNQRKRKLCPMGSQCKYQHEYQHDLEFRHDSEEGNGSAGGADWNSSASGKSRKGGSAQSAGGFTPFSGAGNRLGN